MSRQAISCKARWTDCAISRPRHEGANRHERRYPETRPDRQPLCADMRGASRGEAVYRMSAHDRRNHRMVAHVARGTPGGDGGTAVTRGPIDKAARRPCRPDRAVERSCLSCRTEGVDDMPAASIRIACETNRARPWGRARFRSEIRASMMRHPCRSPGPAGQRHSASEVARRRKSRL